MIRALVIILFFFLFSLTLAAQTRVVFAVAQSASDDWKQGETFAIEFAHSLDSRYSLRIDTFVLSLNLRYAIGCRYYKDDKTATPFVLPTDNELFGEALLKYPIGWQIDPYISANFRTQITESFLVVNNQRKPSAKLWDPVVSQQTGGFTFSSSKPNFTFSTRLGFSLKQTRAYFYTQMSDNPRTPTIKERYKSETGIESKTDFSLSFGVNSRLASALEIFGTFEGIRRWTMRFRNDLQFTLWKSLSLFVQTELAYDERQKFGLQYRQSLRLGFAPVF